MEPQSISFGTVLVLLILKLVVCVIVGFGLLAGGLLACKLFGVDTSSLTGIFSKIMGAGKSATPTESTPTVAKE